MTRRDLTRLLIRVFGLLLLLSTAANLPSTIYGFELQMKMWAAARVVSDLPSLLVAVTYQFGPAAIYAALGLIFMWWSGRIVDRASQVPQNDRLPVASTDLKNIEVSLVAVIGLYFLADGFAELCRFAFSQGLIYSLDGSAALKSVWTAMTGFQVSTLLQILVKLTIGAALVLGRGATIAALHRARHWVQTWRAWPYPPEEDRDRRMG
jgi:hypothetical protein